MSQQVIVFNETDEKNGYLSLFFPAPFQIRGKRWRSIAHYYYANKFQSEKIKEEIRDKTISSLLFDIQNDTYKSEEIVQDWDMKRIECMEKALISKFRNNPDIASKLGLTGGKEIVYNSQTEYWGTENALGRMLETIRSEIVQNITEDEDNIRPILSNFYFLLKGQGYTKLDDNSPIENAPYDDEIRGLQVYGENKEAIIDIYLGESKYNPSVMKNRVSLLSTNNNLSYFVIAEISKGDLNKYMRMVNHQIHIFSPSELSVTPSTHMLSPRVEKLDIDDMEYRSISNSKLPEIDRNDLLVKEKGFLPGDILKVYGFSPHYRRVM